MHNLKDLIKNKELYINDFYLRGLENSAEIIKKIDAHHKNIVTINENMESLGIKLKKINADINSKKTTFGEQKVVLKEISDEKNDLQIELKIEQDKLNELMIQLPNVSHETSPYKTNGLTYQIVFSHKGKGQTNFAKSYYDLALKRNLIDFTRSSNQYGTRTVIYTNKGVKLMRMIALFCISMATKNNYKEIIASDIIDYRILYGTGKLPKFENDLFHVENKYLSPTGENQLMYLHNNEILKNNDLPIKLTTYSNCFRKEAGSAGKDTKGNIRIHQFRKVEIVQLTNQDNWSKTMEEMKNHIAAILRKLNLPFRIIELTREDLGFSAMKTYDFEIYMPISKRFLEVSSLSFCGEFQCRKLNIKYKDAKNDKQFCYAFNGSAVAIDRLFSAFLENYYDSKLNKIQIPKFLLKYYI